jgi:uncharacterized protein DUF1259
MELIASMARNVRPSFIFFAAGAAVLGCQDSSRKAGTPTAQQSPPAAPSTSIPDSTDWKAVDQAMGRSGKMQPDGAYKYSMPRGDLRVSASGVIVKPALALGSWVAFMRRRGSAVAMGDLVLTENEVAPVMSKLQELGVEQTALHNHLLHELPRVMYMHIHAEGDPVKIAQAVKEALALTTAPPSQPEGAAHPTTPGLDTAAVAQALGHAGKLNGGVYQVSVPRAEVIREGGMDVPPSMGVATAINIQPTGGGKAVTTGDFVMTSREVNPVLKALRQADIEVTALHSHMLTEEPRLFFMHFWGKDDAVKLARGLRSALDQMNVKQVGS